MSIVCGLDVHRAQITYDHLDTETGEVEVGRIVPATRCGLKDWLSCFEGQDACCVCYRGCTGWRFVVEELRHAGVEAHLTEPADTATMVARPRRSHVNSACLGVACPNERVSSVRWPRWDWLQRPGTLSRCGSSGVWSHPVVR